MLADNIKRLCESRCISLCALERACDISNGTIARWATASPNAANLKKVADYFGVTMDELMTEPRET